jgi:histidinol dehydrogenase
MQVIRYPERNRWEELCKRPSIDKPELHETVSGILRQVKENGDRALYDLAEKFEGKRPDDLRVPEDEIRASAALVPDELKEAIRTAQENITRFHAAQLHEEPVIETSPGVRCWRKNTPIDRVGLYIPGGTAPLFSTVLMLAVPARIAGCREIIICTPPDKKGSINPLILHAALSAGVTRIFRAGGAQAIAAMAYGTESIPKVDKIFGPGNQYVTLAKELVQTEGTAIDIPAGPSEVLVIADKGSDPSFVAADLLSQAEHGADSQVILLSDSPELTDAVISETQRQVNLLPRKKIALTALENSLSILLSSPGECIEFSNLYAPEHLIISTSDPAALAAGVTCAGSVFLGKYSCESAGDYASGTNHTLPTAGFARSYGGVSAESFVKKITFQEIDPEGIRLLGPVIERMAEAEQLHAHANAVSIRLKSLEND